MRPRSNNRKSANTKSRRPTKTRTSNRRDRTERRLVKQRSSNPERRNPRSNGVRGAIVHRKKLLRRHRPPVKGARKVAILSGFDQRYLIKPRSEFSRAFSLEIGRASCRE